MTHTGRLKVGGDRNRTCAVADLQKQSASIILPLTRINTQICTAWCNYRYFLKYQLCFISGTRNSHNSCFFCTDAIRFLFAPVAPVPISKFSVAACFFFWHTSMESSYRHVRLTCLTCARTCSNLYIACVQPVQLVDRRFSEGSTLVARTQSREYGSMSGLIRLNYWNAKDSLQSYRVNAT